MSYPQLRSEDAASTRSAPGGRPVILALALRMWNGFRRFARRRLLACIVLGLLPIAVRVATRRYFPLPDPTVTDEYSYLLGADTFASGRLTNPAHPLWQHFETWQVISQPTYNSRYPPGQAFFMAIGQKFFG